jgi:hypothetical protein
MLEEVSAYIDNLAGEEKQKALTELEELLQKDRREHPRIPCAIPVTCEIEDHVFEDFVKDISAGGAFVETSAAFSPGESISLTFSSSKLESPMKITGQIVWKARDGIGVKFSAPNKDLEAVILSL